MGSIAKIIDVTILCLVLFVQCGVAPQPNVQTFGLAIEYWTDM